MTTNTNTNAPGGTSKNMSGKFGQHPPPRPSDALQATRNDDGSVTLTLKHPLTLQAEELEEVVANLAAFRADMDPPYPLDCPPLSALEPCYSPRHWVACDPLTGKILLFLRHHLFGWLGIVQTPETALDMLKSVAVEMKNLELSDRDPRHELH